MHIFEQFFQLLNSCFFILINNMLQILPQFDMFFNRRKHLFVFLVISHHMFLVFVLAVFAEETIWLAFLLVAD